MLNIQKQSYYMVPHQKIILITEKMYDIWRKKEIYTKF